MTQDIQKLTNQMQIFIKRATPRTTLEERNLLKAGLTIDHIRYTTDQRKTCATLRATSLEIQHTHPVMSAHMDIIADKMDADIYTN